MPKYKTGGYAVILTLHKFLRVRKEGQFFLHALLGVKSVGPRPKFRISLNFRNQATQIT